MSETTPSVFWERVWRFAGIQSIVLLAAALAIYGDQPGVGAPPETLLAFYDGDRMRILIAASLAGLAMLNLLWFATAIRVVLSNAGQEGWGAAATTASAVFAS